MGVSGCGKSTIGRSLAQALGARFLEGDRFHPDSNIARMRAGKPLGDEDRAPWLEAIGAVLHDPATAAQPLVLACSALRRAYRDALRAGPRPLYWIHLTAGRATLRRRVESRGGHFFNPALLDSQLRTLEAPDATELALALDSALPPAELVRRARRWLDSADGAITADDCG
jgi:gluconokinase